MRDRLKEVLKYLPFVCQIVPFPVHHWFFSMVKFVTMGSMTWSCIFGSESCTNPFEQYNSTQLFKQQHRQLNNASERGIENVLDLFLLLSANTLIQFISFSIVVISVTHLLTNANPNMLLFFFFIFFDDSIYA